MYKMEVHFFHCFVSFYVAYQYVFYLLVPGLTFSFSQKLSELPEPVLMGGNRSLVKCLYIYIYIKYMYIFQRTLLCIRIHNYTLTSACDFQSKFIFYHLTCVYSDCTIRSLRYCTSLLLFTPEESHGACLLFLNLDIRDDNPLASVVSLFGYQLTCY